ncbi:MAG: TraR/DksA C4-type zinc finger protein [Deltaproteobacteria bacterium]
MSEELNEAQAAELADDLRALIAQLDATIEDAAESVQTVELDQAAVGRVSRIDALQRQKLAQASREAMKTRRQLAGQALRRLDDGDYGLCLRCEEPIAYRRLKAKPEAPFCLRCAK